MKRVGFVYDRLLDKEFIKQTIQKASKHKTNRKMVQKVLANIDEYTNRIYEMIVNDNIQQGKTHQKIIQERGKTRVITVSPFYPNQILDYLLVELTKPIIKKSMYDYCIGNVDKRGIMYGKKILKRNVPKYKYFIKLDIRHFYQNVEPKILIKLFEKKIKDKRFIAFIEKVIDPNELPIGCYYSQWFSNFYLCEFDHYMKEYNQLPFYVRYVDDMVIGSNNKKKLKKIYYETSSFLRDLSLEIKYKPIITSGVNFLGFICNKNMLKLRHSIFYKIKRTILKIKKHLCFSLAQRLTSYFSWIKNIDNGYLYYNNNIKPIIKIGKLRHIMSYGGI